MAVEQEEGQFARWDRDNEQRIAKERAFRALPFTQRLGIRLGEVPGLGRLVRAAGVDIKRP